MSDFTHNFWSLFVTIVTVVSILACLVLLIASGQVKTNNTADNTTGHVWDEDLREMNNPLPRWWKWMFILTIVFALAYLIAYPGFGSFPGQLGWSQEGAYQKETETAKTELEPLYARFVAMPPEKMAGDAQAMAVGERMLVFGWRFCVWMKSGNLSGSRTKNTGVLLPTRSQLPSSV